MVKIMRVVWSLFLSVLFFNACIAYAKNDTHSFQIDKQVTAQAPWKVGDTIAEGEIPLGSTDASRVYRKFLGMTSKGYFVVQDFYQESHKKTIDPVVITQKNMLQIFHNPSLLIHLIACSLVGLRMSKKQRKVCFKMDKGKDFGLGGMTMDKNGLRVNF